MGAPFFVVAASLAEIGAAFYAAHAENRFAMPDTASSMDSVSDALVDRATDAAAFLKAMGNERRLMILCHLLDGERSVTELEELCDSRQAAVSQQLARLRAEGFVTCRRDGKTVLYSLGDARVKRFVLVMHELFCSV